MFGRTEFDFHSIATIATLVIAGSAIAMDVARGKIFNVLTFPALLAGLLAASMNSDWTGFRDSAFGAGMGLVLFGWMFWMGAIGGGDVKLLMAFGAWAGGVRPVFETALLSILLGGAFSLVILVLKGRALAFFKKMSVFLMSVFIKELKIAPIQIDRKLKMPFGIPISLAAVWILFDNPFDRWGHLL